MEITCLLVDLKDIDGKKILVVYLPFLKLCRDLILNNDIQYKTKFYTREKLFDKLDKFKGKNFTCKIRVTKTKTNKLTKTNLNLLSINKIKY